MTAPSQAKRDRGLFRLFRRREQSQPAPALSCRWPTELPKRPGDKVLLGNGRVYVVPADTQREVSR